MPATSIPQTVVNGSLVRVASLRDEWYEDVAQPHDLIASLRSSSDRLDVFTFWQRLPDITPRYNFRMEPDSIAALPLTTYAKWWDTQIDGKTRNMVRRAEKKGVVVRSSEFDDAFVQGMASIFNETPIRQGRPFWHYGKSPEVIKREFSRFLFREELLGAYLGDELIGFIMLAHAGKYAELGQIISKIAHRDKAPNNLLLAKAVERCTDQEIPHLVYAKWDTGTLGKFKTSNGFLKVDLPRYYVPLTLKGRIYVALRLYRGPSGILPIRVLKSAKAIRARTYRYLYQRRSNSK